MKGNKHIKSFNEHQENLNISDAGQGFGLKTGKYVLYNHQTIPLPIEITEIGMDGWIEFETDYSVGNKQYWVKEFIGTEMEGLVYDPIRGWFKLNEIEKVEGKKIYLLVGDIFKIKAQRLIDDTKKLKDEYSQSQYKKIIDLEKLIHGTEDDRKKFVKSIMRLLGMTKWDLPDELYRYHV
jgi:hypothetical protein